MVSTQDFPSKDQSCIEHGRWCFSQGSEYASEMKKLLWDEKIIINHLIIEKYVDFHFNECLKEISFSFFINKVLS